MSASKSIYDELMGLAEEWRKDFRENPGGDADCASCGCADELEALAKRVCAEALREMRRHTFVALPRSDDSICISEARRIIGGVE